MDDYSLQYEEEMWDCIIANQSPDPEPYTDPPLPEEEEDD